MLPEGLGIRKGNVTNRGVDLQIVFGVPTSVGFVIEITPTEIGTPNFTSTAFQLPVNTAADRQVDC